MNATDRSGPGLVEAGLLLSSRPRAVGGHLLWMSGPMTGEFEGPVVTSRKECAGRVGLVLPGLARPPSRQDRGREKMRAGGTAMKKKDWDQYFPGHSAGDVGYSSLSFFSSAVRARAVRKIPTKMDATAKSDMPMIA